MFFSSFFWPLPEKLLDCPKKNYFARLWGLEGCSPPAHRPMQLSYHAGTYLVYSAIRLSSACVSAAASGGMWDLVYKLTHADAAIDLALTYDISCYRTASIQRIRASRDSVRNRGIMCRHTDSGVAR